MQPNQQNSEQYVSPSGSNIPDFLHLDPIVVPDPKNKRKKIIVVAFVVFTLFAVGVGFFYLQWIKGESDRRLYEGLGNLMQTNFIDREVVWTTKNDMSNLSAVIHSDFSKPQEPKSDISYTYSASSRLAQDSGSVFKLKGELILINNDGFYAKLDEVPINEKTKAIPRGKWQRIVDNTQQMAVYDYRNLRVLFNTSLGHLIMGSFSKDNRDSIIDYMKSNKIYEVLESKNEILDGVDTTNYVIESSKEKLTNLDSKVASLINQKNLNYMYDSKTKMKIWIDKSSGRVIRQEVTNGEGSYDIGVKFSYKSLENIVRPNS